MAGKDDDDYEDLIKKFGDFCECTDAKNDRTKFTTKACNKLVQDVLKADYGKYEVSQRVDGSVFMACAPNRAKFFTVNKDNVKKFIHKTAHEMAKKKKKNDRIKEDDPAVDDCEVHIKQLIRASEAKSKGTKVSKAGGVDRLTDTSGYTGSHKERFSGDGTGKGMEGRKDLHSNDGYVTGFKGKCKDK